MNNMRYKKKKTNGQTSINISYFIGFNIGNQDLIVCCVLSDVPTQ